MPKMSDEQQKATESDISLPSVPACRKSVIMVKSDDESGEDDESKDKSWVKIGDVALNIKIIYWVASG